MYNLHYVVCAVCVFGCRSKESLEQWREEARLDHLKPPSVELGGPTASDTAPYATDRQHSPMPEVCIYIFTCSPHIMHECSSAEWEYNTTRASSRDLVLQQI